MSLELFDKINEQLKSYTNELAYHVVGDPLVLSNLQSYLDISNEHQLRVNLTTTANNLTHKMYETLMHPAIRQINFSLNSYNANSHKKSLDEYLKPIFEFTQYALDHKQHFFINFRLWNLDEKKSAKDFNRLIFEKTNAFFGSDINLEEVYATKPKSIRVANKVLFNFDEYFEWPSLSNDFVSKTGFCYGLDSHFGILADGRVVPCCLDKDGIINLGSLQERTLDEVLTSQRAQDMILGFKESTVVEELCQKCSYRLRFD